MAPRRPQRRTRHKRALYTLAFGTLLARSTAEDSNSKRGFAYIGDTHEADNSLLTSDKSPLSWYYNWSPYPPPEVPSDNLEFVPLIHGLDEAESSQISRQINSLPSSSTHLLSFNEPDGTTSSGGSSISPEDAAQSYIDHIVPYRDGDRKWNISHPSTTGSGNGLDWLRRFNESCFDIDKENGCPTDFVAAHWYGAFDGLASWLGTLDEFYNKNTSRETPLKIWVTEMALPQADEDATVQMMNTSLPYLEQQEYVERYAWFGAFRSDDANEWTGDGVALFDDGGGLTDLGALYLGGEENGFEAGQKGEGKGAAGQLVVSWSLMTWLSLVAIAFSSYW